MKSMPYGPLMIDIAGTELTDIERQRLCHPLVGGLILFSRNYASPEQLSRLTAEVHALRSPPLLIAIDHEGGRVQRCREGFTRLPSMRSIGELWDRDASQAIDAAALIGYVLASELRQCGVDLSFTPVLDVDWGRSAVVGSRSFHRDPEVIIALARQLISGLRQAGMRACGKHFPGHGWAEADSHVACPTDNRSAAQIRRDLSIYRGLALELESIMTAHVAYQCFDGEVATYSPRLLKTILREELGFSGLIFSDDLSMKGACGDEPPLVRAQKALAAGCDMVLLCNQSLGLGEHVDELLDGMDAALRDGRWVPDIDSESRRVSLLPDTEPQAWDDLMRQPAYLQALFRPSVQPYLISWYKYNPQTVIASLKMPVLILQGKNDIQVKEEDAMLARVLDTQEELPFMKC